MIKSREGWSKSKRFHDSRSEGIQEQGRAAREHSAMRDEKTRDRKSRDYFRVANNTNLTLDYRAAHNRTHERTEKRCRNFLVHTRRRYASRCIDRKHRSFSISRPHRYRCVIVHVMPTLHSL